MLGRQDELWAFCPDKVQRDQHFLAYGQRGWAQLGHQLGENAKLCSFNVCYFWCPSSVSFGADCGSSTVQLTGSSTLLQAQDGLHI